MVSFEWKRDFFCDNSCKVDKNHADRIDWRQIKSFQMRDKIIDTCEKRKDKQSEEIHKTF